MKKAIYKSSFSPNGEALIGFAPGYLWKSIKYFEAPARSGRYLVIQKNGKIREMLCTGIHDMDDKKGKELFELVANDGWFEESYIDDRHVTDNDCMDIYRYPWGRWYYFNEWYEYEDCHNDLHVLTKDSDEYPLYFLDLNLDEKIELNDDQEIKTDGGIEYFDLDTRSCKYVKVERSE